MDQKDKRIRQLESILAANNIPIPPEPEDAPRKRKKTGDVRYQDMPPFVSEYAPYTKGFGDLRKGADPVKEAKRMWDMYYRQNQTEGFKDRHYLLREVPEGREARVYMECGCGVGNALLPLRDELPGLVKIYGFDISEVAVNLLMKDPKYDPSIMTVFQHDMTEAPIPPAVPDGSVDFATLIFVLSAISPAKMPTAVAHIAQKLAPSAVLYFRDYCQGDLAQSRLASTANSLIDPTSSDRFYMRTCGTCSYFFTHEEVRSLFEPYFNVADVASVKREIVNQKTGVTMHRVWVQAKLVRK
eukprot:TRINITY_DN2696_c0_g1_i2.p1 TRINITY_DN2696_c0_g1~~TRINITY_DN2696_c0_g1_i2.p1  ORF type:complete len:335 (+),score=50.77 TRINITY_DN2696_c0_g1_i2:111-1007(+)